MNTIIKYICKILLKLNTKLGIKLGERNYKNGGNYPGDSRKIDLDFQTQFYFPSLALKLIMLTYDSNINGNGPISSSSLKKDHDLKILFQIREDIATNLTVIEKK